MKQIIILVFLLSITSLSAQNVGVNIVSPEFTFDVRSLSNSEPGQFNVSNLDKSKYVRFFSGSDTYPDPSMSWSPGYNFLFATYDDATFDFTEYMRISTTGKLGVGITDPQAKFDLKGGDWNLDAGNAGDLRIGSGLHNLRIGVATGGGGAGISRMYSSNHLIFGVDSTAIMLIEKGGETGFGTTNPSQRVHVNGKLKIGDDAKAPSEGTIRYNSTNNSFEGYDGTKWINLGGSSPYGVQGTFNLPNSSFNPSFLGSPSFIRAAQDLVVIRSSETVQTGFDSNFPPNPIYMKRVYVNLFKKNGSSDWINVWNISKDGPVFEFNFAKDIALSEDRLLIGDPNDKEVREYNYLSGNWWNGNVFESPDSSIDDYFGSSIAIFEDMTIIGAPAYAFIGGAQGPGKAYVYDENGILEGSLSGPGAEWGDKFGTDVDITNNRAIVGAPGNNFGSTSNAGSATVFNRLSGNWSTNNTFYDDTVEEDENYGSQVNFEDSDYFFIKENDGIDAYLIENGYWVLKETISGEGSGYEASSSKHEGFDKMVFYNNTSDEDKIDFLVALERDTNYNFVMTSSLINGTTSIHSYDIIGNEIYTLGSDQKVYIFEY
jgi:hypothetical protein